MSCNHDVKPCAGYGATVGVHICCKCGELITWEKDKYVPITPEPDDYEAHNSCIAGVWGLIAVIILLISVLTIAKYA